jgi:hypothetical protein
MFRAHCSPPKNTWGLLKTVSPGNIVVTSTGVICNNDINNNAYVDIILVFNGESTGLVEQFLLSNTMMPSNNSFSYTWGMTLLPGDSIMVRSSIDNTSFHLFGEEAPA